MEPVISSPFYPKDRHLSVSIHAFTPNSFFKDSGERAWKAIGDRLQRPHYLSRVDLETKIRSRRQIRI